MTYLRQVLNSRGIVILALMIFGNMVFAQESHIKVEDLQEKWLVYDHGQNRYVPYILVKDSSPRSISIIINKDMEDYLVLEIPKHTSVYFNDKMKSSFDKDTVLVFNVPELQKQIKEEIFLTLYNPILKSKKISTYLAVPVKQLEGNSHISTRTKSYFNEFFIASTVIILGFWIFLYKRDPKNATAFVSYSKILSLRGMGDNLFRVKIYEATSLHVYTLYGMIFSLLFISVDFMGNNHLGFYLEFDNLIMPIAIWILLILGVFIGLVFKEWLIRYFTGLFRINGFSKIHFLSLIRVSLGGLLPILVIFVFIKFVLKWYTFDKYQIFIPLIITMFVLRTLIIFLRLMIFSQHRILHLFSYLCATEIIPLAIITRIILN